jgi:hypothetical protein
MDTTGAQRTGLYVAALDRGHGASSAEAIAYDAGLVAPAR